MDHLEHHLMTKAGKRKEENQESLPLSADSQDDGDDFG